MRKEFLENSLLILKNNPGMSEEALKEYILSIWKTGYQACLKRFKKDQATTLAPPLVENRLNAS